MKPPPGKHWQYPPATLDQMDARGEIYWSSTGNPRRKVYLDDSEGVSVQDIWLDFRDAHNQMIKVTGYPTEKNPQLLERIIKASSNPGDLVLDCFAGSGTTMAVASQLGRLWVGIDNSSHAIATTLRRFKQGSEPMGDFVTARVGKKQPAAIQATMFPEDATAGDHRPITDFALYAESRLAADFGAITAGDVLALADRLDQGQVSAASSGVEAHVDGTGR